jgi:hypothetical protein
MFSYISPDARVPKDHPLRPLKVRIDLRNHRKIVVIDNNITYCGSQQVGDVIAITPLRTLNIQSLFILSQPPEN